MADQKIALNQAETWRALFEQIEKDQFAITIEKVCALHQIAARDEVLDWGKFRSGQKNPIPGKLLPFKIGVNHMGKFSAEFRYAFIRHPM